MASTKRTAYRKGELHNHPEVTLDQAAANRSAAMKWKAAGRKGNFGKPLTPRPAREGFFNISRSTFDIWVRKGILPPAKRIAGIDFWPAEVIHQAARDMGLPVPGDEMPAPLAADLAQKAAKAVQGGQAGEADVNAKRAAWERTAAAHA